MVFCCFFFLLFCFLCCGFLIVGEVFCCFSRFFFCFGFFLFGVFFWGVYGGGGGVVWWGGGGGGLGVEGVGGCLCVGVLICVSVRSKN